MQQVRCICICYMEVKDVSEKVMIGVSEIMEKMGIGRDNAYEIIKSGEFPVKKIGRRYLVHEEVFDKWLRGELNYKNKKQ